MAVMINERVLPNPFKAEGSTHLDHVLAAIERELEDFDAPLPARRACSPRSGISSPTANARA